MTSVFLCVCVNKQLILLLLRTCGLDNTCVLCSYCFNAEDHVGHQVDINISLKDEGGVCDCGDPEAWKNELHCKYYQIEKCSNNPISPDFEKAMLDTIETAMDYVIDVFATSDLTIQTFENTAQIEELSRVSRLSEQLYGDDYDEPGKYVLVLWNDQKRSFQDVYSMVKQYLFKDKNFGKMIGEQVDVYGRGKLIVSDDPQKLVDLKKKMKATSFTLTVRGLKEYFREEMCDCIIHWFEDISKSTVQQNHFVINLLLSQAFCSPWRIGNASLLGEQTRVDESIIPPICSSLMGHHIPPIGTYPYTLEDRDFVFKTSSMLPSYWLNDGTQSENIPLDGTRVQYLIFFDVRLWKSLRNTLKDLYISVLVSNPHYKSTLGHCYAKIYPNIAEHYVLVEREPECSIFSCISTQLFTTPTIATGICKFNYFSTFMAGLFNFFTQYRIGPIRTIFTSSTLAGVVSDNQMQMILKNRKYGQLFHDFDCILNRNNDKSLVSGNPERISQLCDLLMIFQGILPLVRQTGSHVEFESDSWMSYFNCIPLVLQLANSIAIGVTDCKEEQINSSIVRIAQFIYRWAIGGFHYTSNENNTGLLLVSKTITFGDFSAQLALHNYRIEDNSISLHHPVHCLLSWFIQFGKLKSPADLRKLLIDAAPKDNYSYTPEQFVCTLFDYPMRTLAFLSQIRTGLWVRNGISVRSQMHYYRDITLRDQAFDRDVFMSQTAFVTLDPQDAFLRFVDTWGIDTFKNNDKFDENQKIYIIEDFLHYLIVFITERRQLLGLSDEEAKRKHIFKEIIQCLAFESQSYSDICNVVPDFLTSDEQFEVVLEELCTFKRPVGIRDTGMYQLKPEYYKYFDTKYLHFSSSKIYDAEKLIKERIAKKEKISEEAVIIEPYLEPINNPFFQNIAAFTRTKAFASFVFEILSLTVNAEKEKEIDSVFSLLLYLCHAAALDDLSRPQTDSQSFAQALISGFKPKTSPTDGYSDVISLLFYLSQTAHFKPFKATIQKVLELLHEKCPEGIEMVLKQHFGDVSFEDLHLNSSARQDEKENKKQVAKRKKKKILDKFQKQQKKFAAQNTFEVNESLEDEDSIVADNKEEHEFLETPCILCHMSCDEKRPFGIAANVQMSNAHRMVPFADADWVLQAYGMHCDLNESPEDFSENYHVSPEWDNYCADYIKKHKIGPGFPEMTTNYNPVMSSCCHVMHVDCYDAYLQQAVNRSNELARNNPDDPKKGELLCPLCRSLNNTFIPISWNSSSKALSQELAVSSSFGDFLRRVDSPEIMGLNYGDSRITQMTKAISEKVLPIYKPFVHTESGSLDEIPNPSLKSTIVKAAYTARREMFKPFPKQQSLFDSLSNLYQCVAGTVNDVELSLRGVNSTSLFLNEIPSLTLTSLRALMEYTSVFTAYACKTNAWSNEELGLYEIEFMPLESKSWTFEELVKCFFFQAPIFGLERKHFLRLFLLKEITRTIYLLTSGFNQKEEWTQHPVLPFIPTLESVDDDTLKALSDLISLLYNEIDTSGQQNPMSNIPTIANVVYTMVAKTVTPFLRKSAVLFYSQCYTSSKTTAFKVDSQLEVDNLCAFLEIPKLQDLIKEMANSNNEGFHLYKHVVRTSITTQPQLDYPAIQELLHLPERLDQFFTRTDDSDLCTNLSISYVEPAVCLFCSATVRTQHASDIPSLGECNAHVLACGRSVGIFLLPKRSVILFLAGAQGSFFPAPYLDLHGEGEETYRRRRPQYLNKIRYDNLCRTYWLQHGIVDFISRRLSSNIDVGGWDTL